MAWLIGIGWLLGTLWAFRHIAEWMDARGTWEDDIGLVILIGLLVTLLAVLGWPLVAVFIPIRGVYRSVYRRIGHTLPGSNRWVDWYFATTREARKEALRK